MFWCLQIVLFVSADVWRYPCERFLHPNQTQGGGGEWKVNTKVKKTFISCLHYLQISLELLSTKKKVVPLKTILWIVTRIMNTFFGNSCCCWFSLYSPPLYWTGGINTWTNKNQDYLNGFISLNEIWVKHHWNSWTLNSFWLKIHLPPFHWWIW